MRTNILIPLIAVGAVVALAITLVMPVRLAQAPEISLFTTSEGKISLADLRGQPVLITFWSTTCHVCIHEMPDLAALYRELSPRGLAVIGISMYYDRPDHVLELIARKNIPYTIALDIHSKASDAFGNIRVTPTSFLVAPDGSIAGHWIGRINMDKLRQQVLGMLNAEGHTG